MSVEDARWLYAIVGLLGLAGQLSACLLLRRRSIMDSETGLTFLFVVSSVFTFGGAALLVGSAL